MLSAMKMALPLFLLAEGTSLFGNAAIAIVLPWLTPARTGDPATAGFVAMITGLPFVAAALVGGHLIDRVGRRRMSCWPIVGRRSAWSRSRWSTCCGGWT